MTLPAIAPYVPTYASRAPYITTAEYQTAPTAVDASNLVEGGTTANNVYELNSVIGRASSWADTICYQILAATLDLQVGVYRVRNGMIHVPLDNTPVLAVTSVSTGWQVGQLQALTDLSGVWIQRKVVTIPLLQLNALSPVYSTAALAPRGSVYAQVGYVNGWPNTTLSAAVTGGTGGATSLPLVDVLGIYPGTVLSIFDDYAFNEQVIVGPGYVPGATTVPIVSPLLGGHSAGVSVSALPPAIKQAVISLTSCLIKTRGNLAMVMASINGGAGTIEDKTDGAVDDLGIAIDLLTPFRRVM
jgi:hypothetical protein